MRRHIGNETPLLQVKVIAIDSTFQVRREAQEEGKANHKDDMEVGKAFLGLVKPPHTFLNKREQRYIRLLISGSLPQ